MAGMLGSGQTMRTSALQSMQRYASLDAKMKADQEASRKLMDAQEQQQNTSLGAAGGAAIGSYFGPIGTVVGGALGWLAGSLF